MVIFENLTCGISDPLWRTHVVGSGPIIDLLNDQSVKISIPANSTGDAKGLFGAGFFMNPLLRGDFEIQVKYNLTDWPPENGIRVGILSSGSPMSGDATERVSRISTEEPGEYYLTHFSDGTQGACIFT